MFFRFALLALAAVAVSGMEVRTKPHPMDGKRQAGLKDMVVIDGMNYFFGQDNIMNWYDAQLTCAGMNMQMLELDTQAKSDMMIQWLLANPSYDNWSWIGLRRDIGVDAFLWESNAMAPMYTGWGPGQPSNSLTYPTCADIAGAFFGAWDDDNCGVFTLSYICEDIPA